MLTKTINSTVNLMSRRNISSLVTTLVLRCKTTSIYFSTNSDRQVNAKSVLGLLSIGCPVGTPVNITITGRSEEGEKTAMEVIENWFADNADAGI